MPAETDGVTLDVEVVFCPGPGLDDVSALHLRAPATVGDAITASGVLQRHGLSLQDLSAGIWARRCELDTPLRERDRVEIYRQLTVDPKEARRLRYKQHKATLEARAKKPPVAARTPDKA